MNKGVTWNPPRVSNQHTWNLRIFLFSLGSLVNTSKLDWTIPQVSILKFPRIFWAMSISLLGTHFAWMVLWFYVGFFLGDTSAPKNNDNNSPCWCRDVSKKHLQSVRKLMGWTKFVGKKWMVMEFGWTCLLFILECFFFYPYHVIYFLVM